MKPDVKQMLKSKELSRAKCTRKQVNQDERLLKVTAKIHLLICLFYNVTKTTSLYLYHFHKYFFFSLI
jgi:hypothetical protein